MKKSLCIVSIIAGCAMMICSLTLVKDVAWNGILLGVGGGLLGGWFCAAIQFDMGLKASGGIQKGCHRI